MTSKTENETEGPIDIYNHAAGFERDLKSLERDNEVLPENIVTIRRFLHDAKIGRTVQKGARRKLSLSRCRKLLYLLRMFARLIDCRYEDVTTHQMEVLVLDLEEGRIRKRHPHNTNDPYSQAFLLDFKKALRKFYRWLMPDDPRRAADLTGWFDMRDEAPELKTFGIKEVEEMLMVARTPQERALVMMLFDGGFRIGELMNVRLRDVRFKNPGKEDEVCYCRITTSKTRPRTISLPLAGREVRFWLERHPDSNGISPDGEVETVSPASTVITYTCLYVRKILRRIGKETLQERLYPHRFRHSSATYYATKLNNNYSLCARYGWSMGSKAVARYLDHAGILADEVAGIMRNEARQRTVVPRAVDERSVDALVNLIQSDPTLAKRLIESIMGRS